MIAAGGGHGDRQTFVAASWAVGDRPGHAARRRAPAHRAGWRARRSLLRRRRAQHGAFGAQLLLRRLRAGRHHRDRQAAARRLAPGHIDPDTRLRPGRAEAAAGALRHRGGTAPLRLRAARARRARGARERADAGGPADRGAERAQRHDGQRRDVPERPRAVAACALCADAAGTLALPRRGNPRARVQRQGVPGARLPARTGRARLARLRRAQAAPARRECRRACRGLAVLAHRDAVLSSV